MRRGRPSDAIRRSSRVQRAITSFRGSEPVKIGRDVVECVANKHPNHRLLLDLCGAGQIILHKQDYLQPDSAAVLTITKRRFRNLNPARQHGLMGYLNPHSLSSPRLTWLSVDLIVRSEWLPGSNRSSAICDYARIGA
jgi:hypothetical protein